MVAQVVETKTTTTPGASQVTVQNPDIKLRVPHDLHGYVQMLIECEHGAGYDPDCFFCIDFAIRNARCSPAARNLLASLPPDVVALVDKTATALRKQLHEKE